MDITFYNDPSKHLLSQKNHHVIKMYHSIIKNQTLLREFVYQDTKPDSEFHSLTTPHHQYQILPVSYFARWRWLASRMRGRGESLVGKMATLATPGTTKGRAKSDEWRTANGRRMQSDVEPTKFAARAVLHVFERPSFAAFIPPSLRFWAASSLHSPGSTPSAHLLTHTQTGSHKTRPLWASGTCQQSLRACV